MVQYMHKQCERSGWLSNHDSPEPSSIGVMLKLGSDALVRHPPTLNSTVIAAFESIDASIAFTMSSVITASLFRQLSPYQTDIVIQPQGIIIPVVESLQQVVDSADTSHMRGNACIVKNEKIILVWTDSVENLLPHGAELEKMLMETVCSFKPLKMNSRQSKLFRCGVHAQRTPDRIHVPFPTMLSMHIHEILTILPL